MPGNPLSKIAHDSSVLAEDARQQPVFGGGTGESYSMPTATVTVKGQVTIPIEAGTRVEFVPQADGTWQFVAAGGSVASIRGTLSATGAASALTAPRAPHLRRRSAADPWSQS